MAIVGVRELLRGSKDILARVQEEQEAFLITNHGKPVAALVPVDPAHAERYLVAAAPDLAATFRDAADEAARGEEPETRSIEELSLEAGDELEPEDAHEPEGLAIALQGVLAHDASFLFGPEVAESFAEVASHNVRAITVKALERLQPAAARRGEGVAQVASLNALLFRCTLRGNLAGALTERMTHLDELDGEGEGLLGPALAAEALNRTTQQLDDLNDAIAALSESYEGYATNLRAAVAAAVATSGPARAHGFKEMTFGVAEKAFGEKSYEDLGALFRERFSAD